MINQELLTILACPQCKGSVTINEEQSALLCNACKLAYEIRNGIPVMLVDEAKKIS